MFRTVSEGTAWKSIKRISKKAVKKLFSTRNVSLKSGDIFGSGVCLMYHRIVTSKHRPKEFDPNVMLCVREDRFEEQIRYLSQNYRCVDVAEGVKELKNGLLHDRTVVISFDDGYRDNLTLALPILEKYQVPAVVYITTGFIDGTASLWWYELEDILKQSSFLEFRWEGRQYAFSLTSASKRETAANTISKMLKGMDLTGQKSLLKLLRTDKDSSFDYRDIFLSWEELKELEKNPLITVGAHTVHHPVLASLDDELLCRELEESKRVLEVRLDCGVDHFSYPFGGLEHAGKREYAAAEKTGFESAFTTCPGHLNNAAGSQMTALPRIAVDYRDTLSTFKWKLSGMEAVASELKTCLR